MVIGKLQLAYDLFKVVGPPTAQLDLLALWPLLLENNDKPERAAWAFGHAMVEYWTQDLSVAQTRKRIDHYLAEFDQKKKIAYSCFLGTLADRYQQFFKIPYIILPGLGMMK